MPTRTQLSLYLPRSAGSPLEAARRSLDPIQAGLIPAHVTLCREDELARLEPRQLEARLSDRAATAVTLHFGRPVAFGGHGILMPCIGGEEDFRTLRGIVLGPSAARAHEPHITLAHPRNPRAPDNSLEGMRSLPEFMSFTFAVVSHIEQADRAPWRVLREFALREPGRGGV